MKADAVLVPMAWSDGVVLRPLNRAARRLLGSEDRPLRALLKDAELAAWNRLVKRSHSSGAAIWLAVDAELSPGSLNALHIGASPDGDGGLLVTLMDRTKQQQAVDRTRRSSQFLKELLDQTPTIFFVVDRGGQVVFRNDAFDRLAPTVSTVSPASMPQLTAEFHRTLGELFQSGTEQQVRVLSIDAAGQSRQLQLDLEPLRDPSGQTHQALVIGFDLTELLGAHDEQRRLQGELEQARRLEALGQMAGTIAHDFNNFLTVMMASTTLLREFIPEPDPNIEGTIVDLEQVTRQARALTQDLVAFSRAQVHAARSSRLEEVLAAIQASLPRLVPPTVAFTLALPQLSEATRTTQVPLSESQVLQIAVNIVQNAIEATRANGVIQVVLATDAGCFDMSISDDGPGVPDSVRARIFEPFFTTRGETGGTGLGLSSARTLVERVGGTLQLTTNPGRGALFRVRIPLQGPDVPGADEPG